MSFGILVCIIYYSCLKQLFSYFVQFLQITIFILTNLLKFLHFCCVIIPTLLIL